MCQPTFYSDFLSQLPEINVPCQCNISENAQNFVANVVSLFRGYDLCFYNYCRTKIPALSMGVVYSMTARHHNEFGKIQRSEYPLADMGHFNIANKVKCTLMATVATTTFLLCPP